MNEAWVTFFTTLAAAAAGLFTILFATLQITQQQWNQTPLKRWTALSAVVELFVPMVGSLIWLMPAHPRRDCCRFG